MFVLEDWQAACVYFTNSPSPWYIFNAAWTRDMYKVKPQVGEINSQIHDYIKTEITHFPVSCLKKKKEH